MVRVQRVPEPEGFDKRVRKRGADWWARNPAPARPKDLWSPFKSQLADGFGTLCGFAAMYEPIGTIDHYLSCRLNRELAYEWSNYRYCSGRVNSSKQLLDEQVLDPFEVQDDWFQILLPSLQLTLTDAVPVAIRECAETTLTKLQLRDGEWVVRWRREWYRMYQEQELTLEGLEKKAPLIARAVRKRLQP